MSRASRLPALFPLFVVVALTGCKTSQPHAIGRLRDAGAADAALVPVKPGQGVQLGPARILAKSCVVAESSDLSGERDIVWPLGLPGMAQSLRSADAKHREVDWNGPMKATTFPRGEVFVSGSVANYWQLLQRFDQPGSPVGAWYKSGAFADLLARTIGPMQAKAPTYYSMMIMRKRIAAEGFADLDRAPTVGDEAACGDGVVTGTASFDQIVVLAAGPSTFDAEFALRGVAKSALGLLDDSGDQAEKDAFKKKHAEGLKVWYVAGTPAAPALNEIRTIKLLDELVEFANGNEPIEPMLMKAQTVVVAPTRDAAFPQAVLNHGLHAANVYRDLALSSTGDAAAAYVAQRTAALAAARSCADQQDNVGCGKLARMLGMSAGGPKAEPVAQEFAASPFAEREPSCRSGQVAMGLEEIVGLIGTDGMSRVLFNLMSSGYTASPELFGSKAFGPGWRAGPFYVLAPGKTESGEVGVFRFDDLSLMRPTGLRSFGPGYRFAVIPLSLPASAVAGEKDLRAYAFCRAPTGVGGAVFMADEPPYPGLDGTQAVLIKADVQNSEWCLDAHQSKSHAYFYLGVPPQTPGCTPSAPHQNFTYDPKTLTIRDAAQKRCLEVEAVRVKAPFKGNYLHLAECTGNPEQQWAFRRAKSGLAVLRPVGDLKKCLDLNTQVKDDAGNEAYVMDDCVTPQENQMFSLIPGSAP